MFLILFNFEWIFGDILDYTARHGIKVSWTLLFGRLTCGF